MKNSVPVRVKIENGMIEGYQDAKSGLQLFLGIPFAKPPRGRTQVESTAAC